jgi:hypothetical protein
MAFKAAIACRSPQSDFPGDCQFTSYFSTHGQCERQRRPLQGESYEYAAQAAHAEALSGLFRVRWLNAGIDNHPAIPANDDHHLPARRCGSNRRFDLSGKDDPRKAGCSL